MVISLTPHAFALAGRNRGLARSMADVLLFLPEGIELRKGQNSVLKWTWDEIRALRYTHFRQQAGGLLGLLGGGLVGRREASFLIAGPEEKVEVFLEIDSHFRQGELRALFKVLYLGDVDLQEFTANGSKAFLLRPLEGKPLAEEVESLRRAGE